MAPERNASHDATLPMAPGPLITLGDGALRVDVAPQAGGRIAQIRVDGVEQLVGHADDTAAAIAWGSYPMVPWAGRIRRGRFSVDGRTFELPRNLGEHAIHGVGFAMPWQVDAQSPRHVELSLRLPQDKRWPLGGIAKQRIEVEDRRARMILSATAGAQAMPVSLGWHPWFLKPQRLEFAPRAAYPRDDDGIAVLPTIAPPPGPWDDCFLNDEPPLLHRAGQRIRLTSDCDHWVVFDMPAHATCVEPQSSPPDAFNLMPVLLAPGESLERWFAMEWLDA